MCSPRNRRDPGSNPRGTAAPFRPGNRKSNFQAPAPRSATTPFRPGNRSYWETSTLWGCPYGRKNSGFPEFAPVARTSGIFSGAALVRPCRLPRMHGRGTSRRTMTGKGPGSAQRHRAASAGEPVKGAPPHLCFPESARVASHAQSAMGGHRDQRAHALDLRAVDIGGRKPDPIRYLADNVAPRIGDQAVSVG